MKKHKELRAISYMAGIFVIAAALLLTVFLLLTALGLIHPRQQRLTLHTPDIAKVYDAVALSGSTPQITYGQLHQGHRLEVLSLPQYTQVGDYENIPVYRILDETGADVTKQYDITPDYGTVSIQARSITVTSPDKTKVYDGTALVSEPVQLSGGTLASGHQLVAQGGNSLLYPGTVAIAGAYQIVSETGADVTNQYRINEQLGTLTVMPITLTLGTESAQKVYDGEALTEQTWTQLQGSLLAGHSIQMNISASLSQVGTAQNEGIATVWDENGADVTSLYHIQYRFGTLQVQPIQLHILTGSAQRSTTEPSCAAPNGSCSAVLWSPAHPSRPAAIRLSAWLAPRIISSPSPWWMPTARIFPSATALSANTEPSAFSPGPLPCGRAAPKRSTTGSL